MAGDFDDSAPTRGEVAVVCQRCGAEGKTVFALAGHDCAGNLRITLDEVAAECAKLRAQVEALQADKRRLDEFHVGNTPVEIDHMGERVFLTLDYRAVDMKGNGEAQRDGDNWFQYSGADIREAIDNFVANRRDILRPSALQAEAALQEDGGRDAEDVLKELNLQSSVPQSPTVAEVEALQADKRRLDWLERRMVSAGDDTVRIEASEFDHTFRVYGTPKHIKDITLRAALDAALQADAKQEGAE